MRKKLLIALLSTTAVSFAQKDKVLDTLANETCDCIKAKNLDFDKPVENLETMLAVCMMQSYSKHSEMFSKDYPIQFGNEQAMEELGKDVGMKMLTHCPDVVLALASTLEDEENVQPESLVIEGQITEIKTGDFVTIMVKDKNNRVHPFLLLHYFDSAALFTGNQVKKNDKVVVTYTEVEMYDPKTKDFRYFKVIGGLEKK